jgi:hypothetical protein
MRRGKMRTLGVMTSRPPDIRKEHAIETYKSLVQISVEGMKLLALLNGGAAVALLAYLGNVTAKTGSPPDMRVPMVFFLAGLLLSGLAFLGSYFTQLRLYEDSVNESTEDSTARWVFWLRCGIGAAGLSLGCFALGSGFAVWLFQ